MSRRQQQRVPVFVDESGSRQRSARRVGYVTAAVASAYALMLAVNLAFQPVSPPDYSDETFPADGPAQEQPRAASPPMPDASYQPTPGREAPESVLAVPPRGLASPTKTRATRKRNPSVRHGPVVRMPKPVAPAAKPVARAGKPVARAGTPVAAAGSARHKDKDSDRDSDSS